MNATVPRQHGEKGVFVGGDWVNIEECGEKFNIKNGSGEKSRCDTCPRSRSKNSTLRQHDTYDVVIIGAGCIGSAIARELSKTKCSVLVLEAADDVAQGATKGSSGIVHAGYDDKPGTNRAKLCWAGNQMFPKLDEELHFGYQRNGSLVLARNAQEMEHLHELKARGETNGVKRLRVIDRKEVLNLEPNLSDDVMGALYAPDAGNMIPYEYAIALAENAVDNGVELRIRREVNKIEKCHDGTFKIEARHWEPAAYLAAIEEDQRIARSNRSPISQAMMAVAMGIVASVIITNFLLPEEFLKERGFLDPLEALVPVERVYKRIVFPTLCITLAFLCYILGKPVGEKKVTSSALASASVGTGGREMTVEEIKLGGSGSASAVQGQQVRVETVFARYVVNAAGNYSDKIAHMIGDDSFTITPRLGNYLLLHRNQGHFARLTLFPCPGPLGKGVLVQTTLWGNLILGPTARDVHLPEVMAEKPHDIMTYILTKCRELVPGFDATEVFHTFCGARAKNTRGDWIIEPSRMDPHFIHAAGIDSPGLAGSPAIAVEVVALLGKAGLKMIPDPTFNPNRAPIIRPKNGWKGIRAGPPGKVTDPEQNVVCKCEKVTEAEVVEALHRSLPVDSTQGVRKRTRAGMGHCQGDAENYNCECRVAEIIARETGLPLDAVGRRPWPATSILSRRWLDDNQKADIAELSQQ